MLSIDALWQEVCSCACCTFRPQACADGCSSRAEMSLVWMQAGFTDVTHLEGGLNQWRYDGYPVMRNNRVYRQEPKRFAKGPASKKRTQM